MNRLLPRFAVDRPVTVVTAFIVVVVVGLIAWARIPLQMMPSGFEPPYLWAWVPYPDSTPVETEASVVRPIEEQLSTVPGIKHLNSQAQRDYASFELEFRSSVDMDEAYNAVADRLERVRGSLPSDVEGTYIWRFNPADEPVIWAGIKVPDGATDVYQTVTRVIQKRLERVPGVGRVEIWGNDEPIVWIEFDREALIAHDVDLVDLMARLAGDNFQLATGRIHERGEVRFVRALSRFETLDEIRRYPLGQGIALGDVASVEYKPTASTDINRIDGRDGMALGINKESSANTVEVCKELRAAFAELEADPRLGGYQFPIFFDQGELIEGSMHTLERTAIEGAVLALIVLLIFLREWRITLLITTVIPISLLFTIAWMYFAGDSLNLLSMLGLMLAVGMVLDNAVVVVESIYRYRQDGSDPRTAAIEGTGRVFVAVTLSALTAMIVFLPVMLMAGDATFSFFMRALGMPVVIVHVGALLASLLFSPLATSWVDAHHVQEDARWIRWLTRQVDRGVAYTLRRPVDTFVGVVAMGILTLALPAQGVGCSDEAEGNLNDFTVRFEVPPAYTYAERLAVVERFEQMAEENQDRWGVRVYRTRLVGDSRNGRLFVYLDEDAEGALPREEVLRDAQGKLPDLPGVKASIGWSESESNQATSVGVSLSGEDTEELQRLATEVERRILGVEGVLGVRSSVEASGQEEIRLEVDRDAASRYGISASLVARLVSFAMRGAPLPSWFQGEKETRVFARFGVEDRVSVDKLLSFELASPTARQAVPLRSLVEDEVAPSWGTIRREDGRTSLTLTAELAPGSDKDQMRERIFAAFQTMAWPRGYGVAAGRDFAAEMENDQARNLALLLSAVFVFLVMGVILESVVLPVAVMTTIPMAIFGVYWGLWATGTSFDAMAGVGFIVLIGIVVNNGIVLMDFANHLRESGMPRDEALRKAVSVRLRPILMTALTAIMGVVPMSVGSETFIGIPYAPLGRVILFGMVTGTVLTLFFVPYLYALLDDAQGLLRWLAARVRPGARTPEAS